MNIIQPDLKFNGTFSLKNIPDTIILHHAAAGSCTVEDIHRWHLNNGWIGIGYHYFVNKQGQVFKGRPDKAVGAHCPGYNNHSIGICAEGSYGTEIMPEVQKQAIVDLIKHLGLKQIYSHGEVYSTSCPGSNFPLKLIKNAALGLDIAYPGYYI